MAKISKSISNVIGLVSIDIRLFAGQVSSQFVQPKSLLNPRLTIGEKYICSMPHSRSTRADGGVDHLPSGHMIGTEGNKRVDNYQFHNPPNHHKMLLIFP